MTDRDIRAMLRGATKAGILTGWQGPHVTGRSYTISPTHGYAAECSLEHTIATCRALADAGIEPLYRASEPLDLSQ